MRRALLLVGLLAGPACALELEGGLTHEELDRGLPDWRSVYLEAAHDLAPRQTLYGMVRATDRFDLRDTEVSAGYYHPLGERWTGQVEASHSSEHNVLPEWSLLGQVGWAAGNGWVASGGLRYSDYTDTRTRVLIGGLEKYFSRYRAFYTLYNGKPEGAGSATAHRVGVDYYYFGERSRIGVAATWGREVENIPPVGVITSDVRAFAVLGRHWVNQDWAVTWELGAHEQGDLYRRTGGRLGLRYRF